MGTLRENIYFEINEAINEEMGIASEVREESDRTIEKIKSIIAKKTEKGTIVSPGILKSDFNYADIIMGKKFRILVTYYNFLQRSTFERNIKDIWYNGATITNSSQKVFFLNVKCYGISGTIDTASMADSVYHELSHLFQGISGNKEAIDFDEKYSIAATKIFSNNEAERNLARLYYFSRRFEGDGYVNGLYGYLKNLDSPIPSYAELEKTEEFTAIKEFREIITTVSEGIKNPEYNAFCKKNFGITINKLLKIAFTSYYRFMRNLGRILIKVRQDKIDEGISFKLTSDGNLSPLIF